MTATEEQVDRVLALRSSSCARRRLGLAPSAVREAARKRYLRLARRLHPDKVDHPRAAEAFATVEAAWRRIDDDWMVFGCE